MAKKIGLDPEEVRQLLMEKHDTALSEDDPILMLVTLQNAFTADYNRLLKRHHEALKKTMKTVLGETAHEMRKVSDGLMTKQSGQPSKIPSPKSACTRRPWNPSWPSCANSTSSTSFAR